MLQREYRNGSYSCHSQNIASLCFLFHSRTLKSCFFMNKWLYWGGSISHKSALTTEVGLNYQYKACICFVFYSCLSPNIITDIQEWRFSIWQKCKCKLYIMFSFRKKHPLLISMEMHSEWGRAETDRYGNYSRAPTQCSSYFTLCSFSS